MKRATKIWLIAAALLIAAGGMIFLWTMLKTGWDFSAFGSPNYETRTVRVEEEFENISIAGDTEDISLLPAADGKCSVVFYEAEKEKHTAAVVNGTLSIRKDDTREWYEKITFFSVDTPKITVYLPYAAYRALTVKGSTGDVALPKDISFADVDISVSTGDVGCFASARGTIRIAADTGDIRCADLTAGALTLSVSTGEVDVRAVRCAGDLNVSVDTGEAFLSDVSCGSFTSDGSTGDLSMADVTAAQKLTVERSTGNVRLEACDASELLIKTDTGDITGTLRTEKRVTAHSNTGRVEVPQSSAGETCSVTSDTGDIVLRIAE